MGNDLAKHSTSMTILGALKAPYYLKNINKALQENATALIIILMRIDMPIHPTNFAFYMSSRIQDHVLHNYMINTGETHNIMPYNIVEKLGLECTKSIEPVLAMDSRSVKIIGEIRDIEFICTRPFC